MSRLPRGGSLAIAARGLRPSHHLDLDRNGTMVMLTFRLRVHEPTRLDSGICVCGAHARVDALRVLVRVNRCACGPGTGAALVARIAKPASGVYEVVYDDSAAGFPMIGRLAVP